MGYSIPITDGNQCTVSHRRGFPIFITDGKSIHRIASKGVHRIAWKGLLPIHRIASKGVPVLYYRRKMLLIGPHYRLGSRNFWFPIIRYFKVRHERHQFCMHMSLMAVLVFVGIPVLGPAAGSDYHGPP